MKTKIFIILILVLILIGVIGIYTQIYFELPGDSWRWKLLAKLGIKPHAQQTENWEIFFKDDFETGYADDWLLETGWKVERDGRNYVLNGIEHNWVRFSGGQRWSDYSFKSRVKLIDYNVHLNYRVSDNGRYFIGFHHDGLYLQKETPWGTFYELASESGLHNYNTWYTVEIKGVGSNIKIYVDDVLKIDYTDFNPLYYGSIAFETLENSHVYFDDIEVTGSPPPDSLPDYKWIRTGGPSGGLGYDVRIHPQDKNIMFVTDNPSGVNKSYDAGDTWVPKNKGIKIRSGPSSDGVPNFALTIDSGNPNIIWAGMQFARGIYKSTDVGETWLKKDNGILEGNELTVRNFGVHPGNSDIVFMGAEIMRGELGQEFDKTKGKIYKTEDGGENWRCVWEGDNLVRFILFDYHNPDTLYASTGIFDREAANDIGVGILKSIDGGETWFQINEGIPNSEGNRFCGFLEMHPNDPKILFAACGNNARGSGGVFKTTNGGQSWRKVLSGETFTIVTFSPSSPNIVYAGSEQAFHRSEDNGQHWKRLWKKNEGTWGPPGIRPGFPIGAVVDPDNPYILFANNYGGGNFKSFDGAETWVDSSTGYTGAHMHGVAIDPENPAIVYALARSGPFQSFNGGQDWKGLAFNPLSSAEWNAVAVNPKDSKEILVADEFQGRIFKTSDAGKTWKIVFRHPQATCKNSQEDRHGFKALAYTPSDPKIIYAGMRKGRRSIDGDFPARASFGMYKSVDGGETWLAINNGLNTFLININAIAVHPSDPDIVYIGTWQDGVFKTVDGGGSWRRINNGLTSLDVRSLAIDPENPEIIYVGLGQGAGILKTENGGELWQPINTGLSLACPPDLLPIGRTQVGIALTSGKLTQRPIGQDYYSVPWTSIWALAVDPTNSQTVYAGDHHSGVYVSFDAGKNWYPANDNLSTKAITDLAISADGQVVYAATEGEGVFRIGEVQAVQWPELDEDIESNGRTGYSLAERLVGMILLQVESHGEAYYVYPNDNKRYYLGRPADAFNVMRKLGLGATHEFITSHLIYPSHVLGKILLDVELNGEAYYIYPKDKKAYYLGRPADAFNMMRELGLGITNENLSKIPEGGL